VHEVGHQYFQGMLASNEFEAAWLDEGLTSWAENRCLSDMVTEGLVPEIRFSRIWGMERVWASFEDLPVVMDRPNWEQRRLVDAFFASYAKPALAIRTLEGLFGEDRLLRAMRAYVADHRDGHPTGSDLQASLERSLGEDLDWFFDALIRGDRRPDWAVLAVRHDEIESADGMVWNDGEWTQGDDEEDSDSEEDGLWRVVVEIGRRGSLVGPVEVELLWADDRRERRTWDSRDRWVRWMVESPVRLRQVVVDPDGVWAIETRRADNYWRDEVADSNALWWLDDALRLVGFLTVPWS